METLSYYYYIYSKHSRYRTKIEQNKHNNNEYLIERKKAHHNVPVSHTTFS